MENKYPANRPMEEYKFVTINIQTGEQTVIDESKLLNDFALKLKSNQQNLDPEFSKIVDDNSFDLI